MEKLYPLAELQKSIYYMQKYSGGPVGVICGSMLQSGSRELREMKSAVNRMFQLNDALRVRIIEKNGELFQTIQPFTDKEIEVLSFSDKEKLDRYGDQYAKISMNMTDTLCEIKIVVLPDQFGIICKMHHLIGDAWAMTLIGNQFLTFLDGETPTTGSFQDYIQAAQSYRESLRYQKDKEYFLSQYRDNEELTCLTRKKSVHFEAKRLTYVIQTEQADLIRNYALKSHASPYVLFMTSLAVVISRTNLNAKQFYIGTPVLNRANNREKNTIGMFSNTLPFLIDLDDSLSFAQNADRLRKSSFTLFRHQKYPYYRLLTDIREEQKTEQRTRELLFDVILSYQNAAVNSRKQVESTWYHNGIQTESLQIHIEDRDSKGIYRIHYDYLTDIFTEAEVEDLHRRFLMLLLDGVRHDRKRIHELDFITDDEKEKVLHLFNDTKVDYPWERCVHSLFEEQAALKPEKRAVIAADRSMTYEELNREANQIAHGLMDLGVVAGDLIAFSLPRRSILFAAMLGILKTGAAYLPIDPALPKERTDYILKDSGAKIFLTEAAAEKLISHPDSSNPDQKPSSDGLCYCIYTSGSTGTPKGTLLTHKNVVNYISNNSRNVLHGIIKEGFENILSVTSASFDIFVTESLLPLANGLTVLLADDEQAHSPSALTELLRFHPADVLQTTPSKMRLYLRNPNLTACLRKVRVIMLIGEVLDEQLAEQINREVSADLYNSYGPTETTVLSSFSKVLNRQVTIGKPIANTQLYILDKYLQPVPVGVTGELCIAGDGVGRGYLNRPDLNKEKFVDNPFGKGMMFRTGDLACWERNGDVRFIGRLDDQIKLHGLRIELGEIEHAMNGLNGISQTAAVVKTDEDGQQILCAFYTGEQYSVHDLRQHLGEKLPLYMIPQLFCHMDAIPITASGKADRKLLAKIRINITREWNNYEPAANDAESSLILLMEEILHFSPIGRNDNFYELGGDSLKALELLSALENRGYHTDIRTVFECGSIKELASRLDLFVPPALTTGKLPEKLPVTAAQERIYTAQTIVGEAAYHIPVVLQVESVDGSRLETAVNAMIQRHDSLRTCFEEKDGKLYQVVLPSAAIRVEYVRDREISTFIQPFDFRKAPMMRVGYSESRILLDLHHIICDGSSLTVLLDELNELYMGRHLENNPVQYREFAIQENRTENTEENEAYWMAVFSEKPPRIKLREDFTRNPQNGHPGNAIYEKIDGLFHQRVTEICRELRITSQVFYVAVFHILLSVFSGSEDVVTGMPVSGREGRFLNTVGMFVNTVVLRSRPNRDKSVFRYLKEVSADTVLAIEHQAYSYSELIRKLGLREKEYHQLFDIMFTYQSESFSNVFFGDRRANLQLPPVTHTKYDIEFQVLPGGEQPTLLIIYSTELYRESTIRNMAECYLVLLNTMLETVRSPERHHQKIADLLTSIAAPAAFSEGEQIQVPALSVYSVVNNLDKGRIVDGDQVYSLTALKKAAEKIDIAIRGKKRIIGLICERSFPELAAIYGIIRGGNAYLPISPIDPPERIKTILRQSGCETVLVQRKYRSLVAAAYVIEDILDSPTPEHVPECAATPDDTLYVIFTSGSTGTPKGAMVSNRSALNRVQWMNRMYFSEETVVMLKTPYTFDVSVWEIFGFALGGYSLYILPPEDHYRQEKVIDHIRRGSVTDLHFVPSVFNVFLEALKQDGGDLPTLKNCFLSGEALTAAQVNAAPAPVHNLYGPTECAVDVSYYDCAAVEEDPIPIGRPIDNCHIYVLDDNLRPVPMGVTGMIFIAGTPVGQGYINAPEQTAEVFLKGPWKDETLYKTGDLGYWRMDGEIVYTGRNDQQVKVNGQRIELGEIEMVMSRFVSSPVVICKDGKLVAFYSGKERPDIRKEIAVVLPRHMIPGTFIHLDTVPLTSSGKVDRKTIAHMKDNANIERVVQNARDDTEASICALFSSVLNIDQVGRLDNFYDLGGTSLDMMSLLSTPPMDTVSPSVFMENPTPAGLAEILANNKKAVDSVIPLYRPDETTNAIVLFSYAGGDAAAFTELVKEFRKRKAKTALYFIPWITDTYDVVAEELKCLSDNIPITFYSHCAGAVTAMKLMERMGERVSRYIAGASIPPETPTNIWKSFSDDEILSALYQAGMSRIPENQVKKLISNFRANTDEYFAYFNGNPQTVHCRMDVVLSKEDLFTQDYQDACERWSRYADLVQSIHYLSSPSHYFQSSEAAELATVLLEV